MATSVAIDFGRFRLRKDLPPHRQLAAYLKAVIALGQAASGEPLPAPGALASQLKMPAAEAKRAYAELSARGYLESEGGRWRISDGHGSVADSREVEDLCERLWELVAEGRRTGLSRGELQRMFEQLLSRS
jgi:DNA-binding transcriptional regulator YhcF (GntR family)